MEITEQILDEMPQEEFDGLVENFDQLDELSKATLGSYIKKSSDAARGHSFNAGQHSTRIGEKDGISNFEYQAKKSNKRLDGVKKAADRLTKESYESLGLLIQSIQEGNASSMSQLFDKLMVEKIAELVEERKAELSEELFNEGQLDELSKKTLDGYTSKVFDSEGYSIGGKNPAKRRDGILRAYHRSNGFTGLGKKYSLDKLTKESLDEMSQDDFDDLIENFDQLDELSKNTLKSYIRKSANNATQLRDKAKNQEKKSLEYNAKAFGGSKEARIKSDTWASKAMENREKANTRLNHRMNAMAKLKASK